MAVTLSNQGVTFTGPTYTNTQKNAAIFPGIIFPYFGTVGSIPTGWLLCDGTNGTPDLRDRFVVGAGSSYGVNTTGGAATIIITDLPSHTHTFEGVATTINPSTAENHTHNGTTTFENPLHGHQTGTAPSPSIWLLRGAPATARTRTNAPFSSGGTTITYSPNSWAHTHPTATIGPTVPAPGATGEGGAHTHPMSIQMAVQGASPSNPKENRPPYYALFFIMKS